MAYKSFFGGFAIFALILLAGCGGPDYKVEVHVIDEAGKPVGGAAVKITYLVPPALDIVGSLTTDEEGKDTIQLKQGNYAYTAEKDGMSGYHSGVVTGNRIITITIRPQPKAETQSMVNGTATNAGAVASPSVLSSGNEVGVVVRVIDATGKPVGGAYLNIFYYPSKSLVIRPYPYANIRGSGSDNKYTDETGTFVVYLEPGDYWFGAVGQKKAGIVKRTISKGKSTIVDISLLEQDYPHLLYKLNIVNEDGSPFDIAKNKVTYKTDGDLSGLIRELENNPLLFMTNVHNYFGFMADGYEDAEVKIDENPYSDPFFMFTTKQKLLEFKVVMKKKSAGSPSPTPSP